MPGYAPPINERLQGISRRQKQVVTGQLCPVFSRQNVMNDFWAKFALVLILFSAVAAIVWAVALSVCVKEKPHYYIVTGCDDYSGRCGEFICHEVGVGKGYWSCYDKKGNKIARFIGKREQKKVYYLMPYEKQMRGVCSK